MQRLQKERGPDAQTSKNKRVPATLAASQKLTRTTAAELLASRLST
jgi:hypothetical protein